jgi:hypothetical protein
MAASVAATSKIVPTTNETPTGQPSRRRIHSLGLRSAMERSAPARIVKKTPEA